MKPQHYYVHKFGGTSVANAERFRNLKQLLSGKNEVIVVSAVHGVTSALQDLLDNAKSNIPFADALTSLEQLHLTLYKALLNTDDQRKLSIELRKNTSEIKDILHAVQITGVYAKEIQDIILGYGEQWSAQLLACFLSDKKPVPYLDASTVLYVYEKNGMVCVDWEKSQVALEAYLKDQLFDQVVITGFIAATEDGKRTTLGRNGSDFSASIFAKLFKAKGMTIWTDVEGIYTADPTRVRSAFVIDSLSYEEALELAYFGAKVLHPMAIAPIVEQKIPMLIKSSLNPNTPGTYISDTSKPSPYVIKGLTCIDQIALVNIEGAGMTGVSGIAARVFQILHHADISVVLIAQASSEHSICFAVANKDAKKATQILNDALLFELDRQQIEGIHVDSTCAILSAVGDAMVGNIGISAKLFNGLARAKINIRAFSQGSSERNISVVIQSSEINKALQAVHAGFYLSPQTISIGIIGPGHIGGTLIDQIYAELDQLKSIYQVHLQVRGIMNSKKMLLSHDPIDLSQWKQHLDDCQTDANLIDFSQHIMSHDVPHAVIIDCTANKTVATHYLDFLEKGIHVITPNKHTNAGDLNYYKALKDMTRQRNTHYLYEATVCAGLPIINTLQDLIKTGDRIDMIEGVFSGTLSYLFNELAKNRPFSEIVIEAKQRGYTEPDPREDLAGLDVARKVVCLAREIGLNTTLDDVNVHNLVPEALQTCSTEEFLQKLPAYDEHYNAMISKAQANHERLAYVGAVHADGSVNVAIQSVSHDHPLARLSGSDNMLVFHTKRYDSPPLIIQGPGAGADVTAAGVFADLLRLVSFLS